METNSYKILKEAFVKSIMEDLKYDKYFLNENLITACKEGDLQKVIWALNLGADINCRLRNKQTVNNEDNPLVIACLNSDVDLVKLLLDKGANVNIHCGYCREPIIVACEEHEVEPTIESKKNKLEIVKLLIDNGANLEEPTNSLGDHTIQIACRNGNLDLVKLLLNNGANLNSYGDISSIKAAAESSNVELVKYLLNRGDVKISDIPNAIDGAEYYRSHTNILCRNQTEDANILKEKYQNIINLLNKYKKDNNL